jgi:UDP-GlcNAc:undecaprenyl-phosphate/decaprenyl-phosphate GlcNAc-1-phosphate transferase
MRSYIAAFVVAAIVAAALTPLVRFAALRLGAVASVGGRNLDARRVPRLGGVAIGLALFVPVIGLFFVESSVAEHVQANVLKVVGLCAGGLLMCVVGVVDDTRGIRALYKLYLQIAGAALAYYCGYRIEAVTLPLVGELWMGAFALPVTVLWVVGIVNAVNLIDGLDGLAAGVVFFAGITNFVVAYIGTQVFTALIMCAMMGAVLGFLFYNFNPARIFMGDSGSYLLGYVLAVSALVGSSQKASTAVALLVPVVALGVPIFDTLFAIVRRFLERRPIFSPDRGHLHHRLLELGLTHRRAVLILYGTSVVFTVSAIAIYLGRAWQIGVALFASSVVFVGLVRFAGVFSQMHLSKRQRARVHSRDTELLRWAMPEVPMRFSRCATEADILRELRLLAEEVRLASIELKARDQAEAKFAWSDGDGDRRRVVAAMTYPIGIDALARAELTVATINDFEQGDMSPQTDILLQVVADLLAIHFARVGSSLAPKKLSDVADRPAPARGSSPELAVKLP